jgi:hypothetical protein
MLGLASCKRKAKGNPLAGRWEGKLTNGLSSMMMQFDLIERAKNQIEMRATARDLFLSSHVLPDWKLEGNSFQFRLPLLDGERNFTGYFSGPTFDVEAKAQGEKIHMRQLGRVPALPYKELSADECKPTNRSTRAKLKLFGSSPLLRHFHADLVARMGIESTNTEDNSTGWFFVEDQPLPAPKAGLPFLIALSPARERIAQIAEYPCPILVLLGEADERFVNLERGARQVAFDLREALTKKGRKMDTFQIGVAPQADRTLRVKGYGKEYPRLGPNYLEHFRRFFARFDTVV